MTADTLHGMFVESAGEAGMRTAWKFRIGDDWHELSFRDALDRVRSIGGGMINLGVGDGDRFCILSNTRVEFTQCHYALLGTGSTVVPIYQTNSPGECEYILDNCKAVGVVVEDAEQLAKIAEIKPNLPQLRHIVVIDPAGIDSPDLGDAELITLADLQGRADDHARASWDARAAAVAPDSLATLIYTSGTTGPPKGCMLTHENFLHITRSVANIDNGTMWRPDDRIVLFLPLAHGFAQLIQFVASALKVELSYSTVPTLMEDLAEVKPTILPAVPRVFEKAYTRIMGQFNEATGVKAKLVERAMKVGALRGRYIQHGRRVPPALAAQYALFHKLVFSKIHARFGGELRLCVSGSAPLSKEVQEFFLACGIIILEGYGLTECGVACSINLPRNFRLGSVGLPIGDVQIKTAEDGELLIRGKQNFQGYFGNEEATREVLDSDGWLHSGDIGTIDKEGFIRITDRKKDIIVTAGGKNIAPQNIENALKATQYVSQALVFGDRKPYLTALITLDPIEMEGWAERQGLTGDMHDWVDSDQVKNLVRQAVDKVNAEVGRVAQVKRFRILPIDFSQETGELTPTLKLKRKVVIERYGTYIEQMYDPSAPDVAGITDRSIGQLQAEPVNA